jgi:acetyl esterase/lipase
MLFSTDPVMLMLRALLFITCLFSALPIAIADDAPFVRKQDVIYGRKDGLALTLDVLTPKIANGAAVIQVMSGGFHSNHQMAQPILALPFLGRGFTVFQVMHGSQPRYQVPEILQDMNRAVRFIRHNAKEFGIDSNRIGITGASSGGNLSLMIATAGTAGDSNAQDPVDRESSRVQAVAVLFPPTDFLNWGGQGKEKIHAKDHAPPFRGSFDYREMDQAERILERITNDSKLRDITRSISPIYSVSADDPPSLLHHGDKDDLVPLEQSERFIAKLKEAGVDATLVVHPGAGHGREGFETTFFEFAEWFDKHLPKAAAAGDAP